MLICIYCAKSNLIKIPTTFFALPYLNEPPTCLQLSSHPCIQQHQNSKPSERCISWSLHCHKKRALSCVLDFQLKKTRHIVWIRQLYFVDRCILEESQTSQYPLLSVFMLNQANQILASGLMHRNESGIKVFTSLSERKQKMFLGIYHLDYHQRVSQNNHLY